MRGERYVPVMLLGWNVEVACLVCLAPLECNASEREAMKKSLIGLCSLFFLAGCAQQAPVSGSAGERPEFTGPYAVEFGQAYDRTGDPFVRSVIADSDISDQEITEAQGKYVTCMSDGGLYEIELKPLGEIGASYSFPPSMGPERAGQVSQECSKGTGYLDISMLYASMHSNPQNEDFPELIAECLVRHGAVPEGYTAEDYRRDYMQGSYPFTDPAQGQAILEQCEVKPLA